jgi:hypothetical protein
MVVAVEKTQPGAEVMLPCQHNESVVAQVQPTIDLLTDLDVLHPDVLRLHAIQPEDYKGGLVFRSAVESIRGSFAASSVTQRQGLVGEVLTRLQTQTRIVEFEQTSSRERYDFAIGIERDPDYFAALEVKGGEGNSINISERPLWAREFGVWCHLDGAIVNQPAHGAHSIVNRLANEMVRRKKHVDVVFFKDSLCGTLLRPCPKYVIGHQINSQIAPDVLLFPQIIPTLDNPDPPVHTLDSLRLPRLILEMFGIRGDEQDKHVWYIHIQITRETANRLSRVVEVWHQGQLVDSSKSRSWRA